MTRAELILYATPRGPLGDALAHRFELLRTTAPTTAQTYPPHCTLTGFFHRDPSDLDRIVAEVGEAVATVEPGPVHVVELHRRADWVGLEIRSDWLRAVTDEFVRCHSRRDDDDPLRPKDWLHLSIGYGEGDLDRAASVIGGFDPSLPAEWEVALWERGANGAWHRRGPSEADRSKRTD